MHSLKQPEGEKSHLVSHLFYWLWTVVALAFNKSEQNSLPALPQISHFLLMLPNRPPTTLS